MPLVGNATCLVFVAEFGEVPVRHRPQHLTTTTTTIQIAATAIPSGWNPGPPPNGLTQIAYVTFVSATYFTWFEPQGTFYMETTEY